METHQEHHPKCDLCSKSFTDEHELNDHMTTDHVEKMYTCDDCDENVPQRDLLKHKKIHAMVKIFADSLGKNYHEKQRINKWHKLKQIK